MVIQANLPVLLTQSEVAEYLHCSEHHVTHLRQYGILKGTRYGKRWMYLAEDINKFVMANIGKDFQCFMDMTPESVCEEYSV
ncbi:MAG: helix-turn-helix domain-containing protein [Solobacterium sp.]|nr:helix-turn-helix domain-containing protein [Solobacterium sp.]